MKQNPFQSMRRIVLANMILLPFIPFILVLGIGYYYFTTSLESTTVSNMERIVEDHRQMIESFLQERKADLAFICNSYTFKELSTPSKLQDVFVYLQKKSHAFFDLGIFNEAGLHIAYHGPFKLTGKIYKDAAWFMEVVRQRYYISDVFLGYRQIPHFVIAVAQEEDGKTWVIRATIDTFLFNGLVEKIRIGRTGEAYILNAKGILQTARRSGGNLMDKMPDTVDYLHAFDGIKTFINGRSKDEKYLYATTWMKDKQWLLVVRQKKSDAFKALRSATYLIVVISLIGGGVITSVAFYLTNRIVRRMEKMDAEKDRLTQQLIGASRLAEIGEMAAGFAHEINNPLQIINSEQSLIDLILSELKETGQLQETESSAEIEDSLDQIKLQVSRCAEITQAILKFARQGEPVPQDVDLRNFIPSITAMVIKKARIEGIAIRQEVTNDISPVQVDPGQLQQVLINLYNNAIDAIIERHGAEGGELVIEAGSKENGKVEISVRDDGAGISFENQNKVFSPFFTTKPVGKGTGLGLSVCYGIIRNMGGNMVFSSKKDVGTTFTIQLPGRENI